VIPRDALKLHDGVANVVATNRISCNQLKDDEKVIVVKLSEQVTIPTGLCCLHQSETKVASLSKGKRDQKGVLNFFIT